MSLKNIIINKINQNNTTKFVLSEKVIDRLKKYSKLHLEIDNSEFKQIKQLNLFDQIILKKILLYEPTEYDGWLLFLDYFAGNSSYLNKLHINNSKQNILIDSDLCGFIELSKYLYESDDNYFINELILSKLDDKKIKYLMSMYKISSVDDNESNKSNKSNKYNIIISKNIDHIQMYKDMLSNGGEVLLLLNIDDIGTKLIEKINNELKYFDQIEFISPSILKITGEFIVKFRMEQKETTNITTTTTTTTTTTSTTKSTTAAKETTTTDTYGNIMMKANDFFNYHIYKVNKILNSIKHIIDITNSDLQKKVSSVYSYKLLSGAINIFNIYNIPVNTNVQSYYDNKLITINNKLYSSLNVISFQFINYELLDIKIKPISNKIKTISEKQIREKYINLHGIAMNLNKIKRAIDTKYLKKWQYVTYQLDNYKNLGEYVTKKYELLNDKKQRVSNAFLKIYELMMTYEIVPSDAINFKSFHFCEAPGMFIIGLNHYLQTKTKVKNWSWHGNSLTIEAEKTALTDSHGLIRANKDKWLIGPESSGDIRSLTNINYFKSKLESVDFITSDCGICVDPSMLNKYEEMISETDFAQFINMINLLRVGGSGITKTFIPLELPSNVCIIYMMTQLFEEVYLSKPITSRPQNSEVYLVGKNFLGISDDLLNKLKSLLDKSINPIFDPHLQWIEEIPQSFISQLEDYIVDITRQQISYLLNIFHFVDNTTDIDKIKLLSSGKLKEVTNEYWCKKFKLESNKKNKLI